MGFLENKYSFFSMTEEVVKHCHPFTCGDSDLDEFFQHDALLYNDQLLGKTYCFRLNENPANIICAFTLSNDSIRMDMLPNSREKKVQKHIPHEKQMRRYPGVLIGRLGINKDFVHQGIGCEVMEFIKSWFIDDGNKTGCRFLIVDAYNKEDVLRFYTNNGFSFLFSTESQEAKNLGFDEDTPLKTRLMYFDLITLAAKKVE